MIDRKNSKTIFGIDLGTAYSCIAYIDNFNRPSIIRNSEGEFSTPSVVQFDRGSPVVGTIAKNCAIIEPEAVVAMAKRYMGEASWEFSYDGATYTAEQIASYILRKLIHDAEEKLERPVRDVVITCPAYFGLAQRMATRRAAELAGLTVQGIINEPTAAALFYSWKQEQTRIAPSHDAQPTRTETILIYDLGGGTFDVTVNEIKNNTVTVVAIDGDQQLGGRDWDEEIVSYFVKQWQQQKGMEDRLQDDRETYQDMLTRAERAKIVLSARTQTREPIVYNGKKAMVTLTREEFERFTMHLLNRTIIKTKAVLEATRKKGVTKIDRLLLVGGSARMPQVVERLEKEFAIPIKIFEPDEAVAKGAALYGQKLLVDEIEEHQTEDRLLPLMDALKSTIQESDSRENLVRPFIDMHVMDVASHSFGIIMIMAYGDKRSREVISNLIMVNDPLPKKCDKIYITLRDDQQVVTLKIMETLTSSEIVEPENYHLNQQIGKVSLNLPPNLPAGTIIKVQFELDRQGLLRIIGTEEKSNKSIVTTIKIQGVS